MSFQKFCGNIRRNYHKVKGFQFFIRERERERERFQLNNKIYVLYIFFNLKCDVHTF